MIGINTLAVGAGQAEPGVQAQGIRVVILINTAKPHADHLLASGCAVHPYLRIQYAPLTPSIAAQLQAAFKTASGCAPFKSVLPRPRDSNRART